MDQHDPTVLDHPLLAIAGLSVRDILGYTTITLFVSGGVMLATLLLVGVL